MQTWCGILSVALAAAGQGLDGKLSGGPAVVRAIETYQPAWVPPRGELRGTVVVIDAAGGGAKDVEKRRTDDLAQMTASHLYHMVRRAGGVPVMTRADDRPMPGIEAGRPAALKEIATRHKAHLIVTIDFTGPGSAAPLAGDALSGSLADRLAEAVGVPVQAGGGPRRPLPSDPGTPGASLSLAGPEDTLSLLERQVFQRGCAVRIYKGIAAFVKSEHDGLHAARASRFPDAESSSAQPVPLHPDRPPPQKLVRAARRIWPEGNLPAAKAAWYCRMFRQVALSDRTMVYLEPEVTVDGDTVVVGGATNVAYLREALAVALRSVGVEKVRNELRVLPEDGRLGEQRFGACVAAMALTFNRPSEAAGVQTQLLYGEPLLLLDRDAGYWLVHGSDGYWGWVRQESVRTMTADEFKRHMAAGRAVLRRDLELSDRRVVRGSTLRIASVEGSTMTLMHPDGTTFDVAANDVRVIDDSSMATERITQALTLLHRPYVFGAVSPLGMDCSGLVRNVSAQTGLAVARDAAQQFLHGKLVATRWYRDGIRPGDYLYFIDTSGKIFHTGLAISPTHFVHCSAPEVQISSLQKGDRLYSEHWDRTFLAAKRP